MQILDWLRRLTGWIWQQKTGLRLSNPAKWENNVVLDEVHYGGGGKRTAAMRQP